jgi:hypothetical protein
MDLEETARAQGARHPSTCEWRQQDSTAWDANSNLASVTPPDKPIHTLGYDAINQLTSYTPPVVPGVPSPGTSYSFDLDRKIDSETRPGSILLDPAYDGAGRLDSVAVPGGLLDQTYYSLLPPGGGAPGRLATLLGPYGVNLAYQYDGSLITRVTWSGLVTGNVAWTYNSDFLPTTETVAPGSGSAVSAYFGYDLDNLSVCASLTSCAPPASDALNITRSPSNGLITAITLGSVTETYGYNGYGELVSQASTFGGTPLATLSYDTPAFGRDALGRITRKTEVIAGVTTTFDYAYDSLGRLTDVLRNGALEEHFEYDSNGNRTLGINATAGTTYTGTYDDQDRLLSYGPATYTYTPNGELATKTSGRADHDVRVRRAWEPALGGASGWHNDHIANLCAVLGFCGIAVCSLGPAALSQASVALSRSRVARAILADTSKCTSDVAGRSRDPVRHCRGSKYWNSMAEYSPRDRRPLAHTDASYSGADRWTTDRLRVVNAQCP